MSFGKHVVLFFSTGFFLGNIPVAPGTFGSLIGLPVWFLLSRSAPLITLAFLVLFIPFSIWMADASSKILQQEDPGCIVIDEVVGMVVTLAGLQFNWTTCAAGFMLFRFLDAVKPFPIRWVDNNLRGGAGIVLDDILAGIIGNITLRIIL